MESGTKREPLTQVFTEFTTVIRIMRKTSLKLTNEEQDFLCWEESYYKDNVRADNKRAARYAWRRVCLQFPRLNQYICPA